MVFHKDVGPLISMEEMSRCIHCTRCVRFGQEIAGSMELGMSQRGEHSEIEAFVGDTVDSELSGNMIDICPVGALTSKPFRYQARTWEMSRRKSVSPHDATGANLIVQVKNNRVMRVVPLENEEVNECWIADRDRFSYEALNSDERLTQPMLKQDGQWITVDWSTALEYIANGLQHIKTEHGASAIGCLASPHSTLEELYLATQFMRGLGSDNIDSRLRAADFQHDGKTRWLGTSLASLSTLDRVLIIGSNIRKDQPLLAQRIRQAVRRGAKVHALNEQAFDWAMPLAEVCLQSGFKPWPISLLRSLRKTMLNYLPPAMPLRLPRKPLQHRYCLVNAKPCCWAMQPRTTPKLQACWPWPISLQSKPVPASVTWAKRPTQSVRNWCLRAPCTAE